MVLDQGHPLAHICLQLDVSENGLRRWVQQVQFERNGGVPETKALTDEQRRAALSACKVTRTL
jgi:transposase